MLELGQTEIEEIRRLVLDPTPANFQAIQAKLEYIASTLSRVLADPEPILRERDSACTFLQQLPREMARVRVLMHAPLAFYQGLQSIYVTHFGAYERSGEMRSLTAQPFSRTVVHL